MICLESTNAPPNQTKNHPCLLFLHRVDINNDKKIGAKEMQRWIMEKTDEHFQEAVEENKMHFRAVDPDGDGKTECFLQILMTSNLAASWQTDRLLV